MERRTQVLTRRRMKIRLIPEFDYARPKEKVVPSEKRENDAADENKNARKQTNVSEA